MPTTTAQANDIPFAETENLNETPVFDKPVGNENPESMPLRDDASIATQEDILMEREEIEISAALNKLSQQTFKNIDSAHKALEKTLTKLEEKIHTETNETIYSPKERSDVTSHAESLKLALNAYIIDGCQQELNKTLQSKEISKQDKINSIKSIAENLNQNVKLIQQMSHQITTSVGTENTLHDDIKSLQARMKEIQSAKRKALFDKIIERVKQGSIKVGKFVSVVAVVLLSIAIIIIANLLPGLLSINLLRLADNLPLVHRYREYVFNTENKASADVEIGDLISFDNDSVIVVEPNDDNVSIQAGENATGQDSSLTDVVKDFFAADSSNHQASIENNPAVVIANEPNSSNMSQNEDTSSLSEDEEELEAAKTSDTDSGINSDIESTEQPERELPLPCLNLTRSRSYESFFSLNQGTPTDTENAPSAVIEHS